MSRSVSENFSGGYKVVNMGKTINNNSFHEYLLLRNLSFTFKYCKYTPKTNVKVVNLKENLKILFGPNSGKTLP